MLGRGRECSTRLIASNLQSTIRDLQRRKARGRRGLALIEGVRLVEEALAAGVTFTGALVAPDLARTARGTALVAELEGHAVGVEEVGARVLAQLADTETPQGIIAVIEPRRDRKSTRLNSSHTVISYAVFCLKKKKKENTTTTIDSVN